MESISEMLAREKGRLLFTDHTSLILLGIFSYTRTVVMQQMDNGKHIRVETLTFGEQKQLLSPLCTQKNNNLEPLKQTCIPNMEFKHILL